MPDQVAWDEIWAYLPVRLKQYFRYLGLTEDADDLTAIVCLLICDRLLKKGPPKDILAYAFGIAQNVQADFFAGRYRRREISIEDIPPAGVSSSPCPDEASAVDVAPLHPALKAALASLPPL